MLGTKRSKSSQEEQSSNDKPQREEMIRANVIKSLGYPKEMLRMAVVGLWGNNYRVNVVIGADSSHARISHSYFVEADDTGNILKSTPEISRQY